MVIVEEVMMNQWNAAQAKQRTAANGNESRLARQRLLRMAPAMYRRASLAIACVFVLVSCNDDTQFNRSASVAGDETPEVRPQRPSPNPKPRPVPTEVRSPERIKDQCQRGEVRSITKRLSFFETRTGCDYGRNGNLSRRQGRIRARKVETISVDLPDNASLCQLKIDSVSRDLRYDDFMFFNVNDIVLVGSSGQLMRKLNERRDIFRFDFDRIKNERADFFDLRRNYCLGGAGECQIPGHDKEGPMTIDFVSDQIFNLSSQLGDADELEFSLVTTGDDDNDCFHTDFILDLEARYTVF